MKKIFFLLVMTLGLAAYEESHEEFMERMVYTKVKIAQEIRERSDSNPKTDWRFNSLDFRSNEAVQSESLNQNPPANSEEFVAQQARLGRCFKGHQGIFLDMSFYDSGVWLCKEKWNGETCPWNIERHYPNGIPKVK